MVTVRSLVSQCGVCLLPSAFWLLSCSELRATAHDVAHHAFMTLPPYARIRDGEAPQLGGGLTPCRQSFCLGKCPLPTYSILKEDFMSTIVSRLFRPRNRTT